MTQDLDKFSDSELLCEMYNRGYDIHMPLSREEISDLITFLDSFDPQIGSRVYFIREKLKEM